MFFSQSKFLTSTKMNMLQRHVLLSLLILIKITETLLFSQTHSICIQLIDYGRGCIVPFSLDPLPRKVATYTCICSHPTPGRWLYSRFFSHEELLIQHGPTFLLVLRKAYFITQCSLFFQFTKFITSSINHKISNLFSKFSFLNLDIQ